jgi:hypothetical protein
MILNVRRTEFHGKHADVNASTYGLRLTNGRSDNESWPVDHQMKDHSRISGRNPDFVPEV